MGCDPGKDFREAPAIQIASLSILPIRTTQCFLIGDIHCIFAPVGVGMKMKSLKHLLAPIFLPILSLCDPGQTAI